MIAPSPATPAEGVGLTPAMRDALLVIQELTALDGRAPTAREIAHELCLADSGRVHRLLLDLKERGRIDWVPGQHRSIRVLQPVPMPDEPGIAITAAAEAVLLPLLGGVG